LVKADVQTPGLLIQSHGVRLRSPAIEIPDHRGGLRLRRPDPEHCAENFPRLVALEARPKLICPPLRNDGRRRCARRPGRCRCRRRGGCRPGHFPGGYLAQIRRLMGKSQRTFPIAHLHGLGIETDQCDLLAFVDFHFAGQAALVNDRKGGVFLQGQTSRSPIRIFDQPSHGVCGLGLRLGTWFRCRFRPRRGCRGGCQRSRGWLDQITSPFEGAMSQLAHRFDGRALAAPLVESPSRTTEQSEQGQSKEDPANPSLTLPSFQLMVDFWCGRRRGIGGQRRLRNGRTRRRSRCGQNEATLAQGARDLVARPTLVHFEHLVTMWAGETHGAGRLP
jgi:hypothetical protein